MVRVAGSVSYRGMHSLSPSLIVAAQHFATLAQPLEINGVVSDSNAPEHRAYVMAAVMSAAAAVEAAMNWVAFKLVDGETFSVADNMKRRLFISEWKRDLKWNPFKDRFNRLEELGTHPVHGFRKGDLFLVVDVRNALMHYEPVWHDHPGRHGELRADLEGKFPIINAGTLNWFPNSCLSAGCALWVSTTAEKAVKGLAAAIGVEERFLLPKGP